MSEQQWSPKQGEAIQAVQAWLKNKKTPQVFRLFGYAGTGKTTLAKHLASSVKGTVLYACFTGKAALVLRKKGCEGASTIHSLIYKARQDERTGEVEFILNRDSPASTATLIVIDEVSMVNEEQARDLLSFGVKILVLGDPAQLPPVKGEGFFINGKPDFMLTEVHRQAAENPIIRMSMDVRNGIPLTPGQYGSSLVVSRNDCDRDRMRELVLGADQLLCGLNRTRQTFNSRIRELKGLQGEQEIWQPTYGDRLVCLRNNREKNLLNGGLWEVTSTKSLDKRINMMVESLDEDGAAEKEIEVLNEFFLGTEKELDWRQRKAYDEFTFGWALTCHKSQGSQWDKVIVFDESSAFRDNQRNWLYTAITRAAESLTVVV